MISSDIYYHIVFKRNAQFVERVTFESLMNFKKKTITKVENIIKTATFKSFLHLSYKST